MYETTLWVALVAVVIPSAVSIMPTWKLGGYGLLLLGLVALVVAARKAFKEQRQDDLKFTKQMKVLDSMLEELRKMRERNNGSSDSK
jgi:hypothetical protein